MTLTPTTVTPSRSRPARGPQISSWCAISGRCSDFTDPISRMVDRPPSKPRSILNVIHRRLFADHHVCKGRSTRAVSNLRATRSAVGNAWVLLIVRAAIARHLKGLFQSPLARLHRSLACGGSRFWLARHGSPRRHATGEENFSGARCFGETGGGGSTPAAIRRRVSVVPLPGRARARRTGK